MTAVLAFRRMIVRACVLGLAGLFLNLISQSLAPNQPVVLGNILLFISARTYGIIGGTIAALITELPMNIFGGSDPFLMLRTITLAGILGFSSRQFPQLQIGIPLAIFWNVLMLPFYLIVVGDGSAVPLIFLCASDLLLLSLSSLLLCSSVLWEKLTAQLRHLPMKLLLPECLFAFLGLIVGLALLSPLGDTNHLFSVLGQAYGLYTLVPLSVLTIAPTFIGFQLTAILSQDYQTELQGGFLPHARKRSFSGLASAYWRQKTELEINSDVLSHHSSSLSAPTQGSSAASSGFIAPSHGVIALNRNGTITFLNRKFKKFAEVTSNDIIGRSIDSIGINAQFRKEVLALVEVTFEHGPRINELRISQYEGTQSRFYELASQKSDTLQNSSLYDGPDGVVITVKDITDRRTVETHLLQAKKLESLGSMASGIAHSFNDALTSIAGQASLAKVCTDPVRIQSALTEILNSSHQAGIIVRQLLDFAQSSSDLLRNEDLVSVIEGRLDFFKRSLGDTYELIVERSPQSLLVQCNTNLMVQALLNLILNSKESYGEKPGVITLSLDVEEIPEEASRVQPGVRPGRFARIRIKDEGTGMSAETLSKAFDPLFTTKSASGHAGLGLSIVFAVVRAHDGFLTAESHVEKGSTVSLYFPLRSEKDIAENPELSTEAPHEAQRRSLAELPIKTILVIEDDASVRGILELMLSTLGFTTLSYGSGPEALELLDSISFDMFIIDLILPKMGGVEVAQAIRSRYPAIPGILMTGYGLDAAQEDPTLFVLRKPFDLVQLTDALLTAHR